MATKNKSGRDGEVTKPVMTLDLGYGALEVFMLNEHQWMKACTGTNHRWQGPAMMLREVNANSGQCYEHHTWVDDPKSWERIKRAMHYHCPTMDIRRADNHGKEK